MNNHTSAARSAEQDCADVVLAFFRALDQREHASVAALLSPSGTWHRQGAVLNGPQAVLDALSKRDPNRHTAHVITNVQITMQSRDRATARFYLVAYESQGDPASDLSDAPRLVAIRDCVDELVQISGQWQIQQKTSRRQLPPER